MKRWSALVAGAAVALVATVGVVPVASAASTPDPEVATTVDTFANPQSGSAVVGEDESDSSSVPTTETDAGEAEAEPANPDTSGSGTSGSSTSPNESDDDQGQSDGASVAPAEVRSMARSVSPSSFWINQRVGGGLGGPAGRVCWGLMQDAKERGRDGAGSAIIGAMQAVAAAVVAPLVGLGGETTAVPMAVAMVVCAGLAILGAAGAALSAARARRA